MIKIGIDLAVRTVGLAIKKDNQFKYESYTSKEKNYTLLQIEMTDWVFNKIDNESSYIKGQHSLIIEDLFVGLDPTSSLDAAKVHGSVIYEYNKRTKLFPKIVGAIGARNLVNIASRASKAEIQMAVIDKLGLGLVTNEVRGEIVSLRNHYELIKKRILEQKKIASSILKEKLNRDQSEAKRIMDNGFNRMSTQIR